MQIGIGMTVWGIDHESELLAIRISGVDHLPAAVPCPTGDAFEMIAMLVGLDGLLIQAAPAAPR